MGQTELLELGEDEERTRRFRRAVPVVLVAAVLLAVVAVVVDHRVREREQHAVAACAREVGTAVDLAGRPVHAAYEYVRPVLADGPRPRTRDGFYLLVAKAARGADTGLGEAERVCADVSVFTLHDSLAARRDRCVDVLAAQRSGLRGVAAEGAAVLEWMQVPRTC